MSFWDDLRKSKMELEEKPLPTQPQIQVQPQPIQTQPIIKPQPQVIEVGGGEQKIVSNLDVSKMKFDFTPHELPHKMVITIYGEKGDGKTTFAEGLGGRIVVLSFDRKSSAPKVYYHNNDPNIIVYDCVKYWNRDTDKILESSAFTWEYVKAILERLREEQNKPDWIVIDGIEIFQKIAEFVMRHRHGLSPYQGVANMNLWKERNDILENLHRLAFDVAKKGVVYTTYTDQKELIEDGTVVVRKNVPRYLDVVMWETDIVLYIEKKFDDRNKLVEFWLRCDSSKFPLVIKTGAYINITNKKAKDVLNLEAFFGKGN